MTRRAFAVSVVSLLMAAGCITPPGPPPGWVPPVIESMTMSTDQLTPGSTFSVSVTASDDEDVRAILLNFHQPNGDVFDLVDCRLGDDESDSYYMLRQPGPVVSVVIDCTLPFAPNGDWEAEVIAQDWGAMAPGARVTRARIPFQVTGGSDDTERPRFESVAFVAPPVTGSWFDVTLRVSDNEALEPVQRMPTMVYWGTHMNAYSRECFHPKLTRISATVQEWTFSCQANTDGRWGTYLGAVGFHDAAGNRAGGEFEFEMLPAS